MCENCCVGISVVIAVGIALVIIVYATLFVVCVLFIRKYDARFSMIPESDWGCFRGCAISSSVRAPF